jgi:SH3 domain-containing YSC84-like protein 1
LTAFLDGELTAEVLYFECRMNHEKEVYPMKWPMVAFLFCVAFATTAARADQTKVDVVDRLQSSTATIQQIIDAPDKGIPDEVLKGAKCIAIVPSMLKGGFIFGAKHGRGVSTCRLPDGHWSAPAFFAITGGSWGLQIGVEDIQLVMMIMNDDGMRNLLQDKFQIGGNASAAAGPVGRHASAGTDWKASTEILTYSRAHGLFAGIDLDGSWVQRDKDSTLALYGRDYTTTQILTGEVAVPQEAHGFLAEVERAKSRDNRASMN